MSRDRASRGFAPQGAMGGYSGIDAVGKRTLVEAVQCRAGASEPTDAPGRVQAAAAHGTSGSAVALPHADRIQRLFGRHSISGVRAYVGGPAAEGAAAMGAQAFATGDQIAFGQAPDLHTAAHEAAHVVQQRAGVHLKSGVGQAGDTYEQHADAVADLVVQGKSAEPLLDQLSPAGHAGVAGAAPIQRLQTTIRGTVRDITKAELRDLPATRLLFVRLGLTLPAKGPDPKFIDEHAAHINTLAAAIDLGSLNANIFMDVLGAIVDGRPPDWAVWDANELNLAGPADPATLPGKLVEGQLQTLVKQNKYQDALELLRLRYRPAGAVGYHLEAVENFSLADGSVVENAYAAVMPGETTIQVKTQWIERFVLSGQIGNLINVIEHEATHVKQNVHAPGVTDSANDEDVREFEAYCREIQVTIQRCAHDAEGHLQTRVQFEKAVTAARKHRKRAQERHVLVSRHATQWEHIEAALPATRAGLDKADAARAVYARDDAEVRDLLAKHHKKYIELGTLYDGADGIRRADELTAEADGLHILQAFARLPADATAAYRVSYEPEANAFLEFRKHRRLPRRPAARTEPTAAASSSLLAPPPGSSPLLPPPPGSSSLLAPPPGKSSLLAPPPSSKSSLLAPPPSASPRSSSTLSSPPVSVSKPSAAKDKAGDESDEEWGAYTSAPSDLSASSAAAAPAPKPPTPPTSGTPASKPPTTPTTSPGADDDWQPFQ